MATTAPETDITLYTFGTPNGQKASIVLEELGIKYRVQKIDIMKNVQKEDWFLKINPNGRIPALLDRTNPAQEQRIFEGASILLYLTHRYDPLHKISYPHNTDRYWETVNWLAWQHGGIGPMQGQLNHFALYAPERIPYAIERYANETRRLYSVLERELASKASNGTESAGGDGEGDGNSGGNNGAAGPWLVGDKCTIADLACFSWVNWGPVSKVDMSEFKHVSDWVERINARPGVQRGLEVPEPSEMLKKKQSKS